MQTDVLALVRSPLMESRNAGSFLRLVLAEAALYGMPPQVLATLDDLASLLGHVRPLAANQVAALAGPLCVWRSTPGQPVIERVAELEALALKQRALLAFGGAAPGHMVGTAEIVVAAGNLMQGTIPSEYLEVYHWAAADVLGTLKDVAPEKVWADRAWSPLVADDDVLRPGGRLHPTYVEIATGIRRNVIAAMEQQEEHPRNHLRPLARAFLKGHARVRAAAEREGHAEVVARLDQAMEDIRTMYPGLCEDHDTA